MSKVIYTDLTEDQCRNVEFAMLEMAPKLRAVYKEMNLQTRFSISLHTICISRGGSKYPKLFKSSIHYPRCEQKFCSCLFEIFASLCNEIRNQPNYSRFYRVTGLDFNIEPRI